MIKIIVDSTCDLPEDLLRKHGIITTPMLVSIGDSLYRDKIDVSPDDVYRAMRSGVTPKTAQIDLGYLSGLFEDCCQNGCDFIYIAFSSALSCTCRSAEIILADFKERYPERKMAVADSFGGSMSTGLIALQAARLVENNYDFASVLDCILDMRNHTEHIFTILDIKWLVKGGRIDPLKGLIGSLLNVKPVIHVKNGSMDIIKKVRGSNNAISALIDVVADRIKDFPEQLIAVAHAGNKPGAETLIKKISDRLDGANFIVSEIGSVLAAHIGIGALGVFFFNKKPAHFMM